MLTWLEPFIKGLNAIAGILFPAIAQKYGPACWESERNAAEDEPNADDQA